MAGGSTDDRAQDGSQLEDGPALAGRFLASLDNLTVATGQPFNVTLEYLDDNATDASLLTWQIVFTNSTGNGTGVGNRTQDTTGNGTGGTMVYNGTGLPAVLEANLTFVGNVTLSGTLRSANATATLAPLVLHLVAPAGDVDPCAGVVPEPVAISGQYLAAAVAGQGFYQSNPFNVPPCVTSLHATVTGDTLMLDIMLRLRDSGNSQTYATSNAQSGHTEELEWVPEGGIAPGTYDLNIRGQVAGPGNYKGTITFNP